MARRAALVKNEAKEWVPSRLIDGELLACIRPKWLKIPRSFWILRATHGYESMRLF